MIILGLGSNVGDRGMNIITAIKRLAAHPEIIVTKTSSFYETEPFGVKEQPNFLNAVISITCTLAPFELLTVCLDVEAAMGRIRQQRWGPRNIDIDILIYENANMVSERLILPHPHFHERNFVLIPLIELVGEMPVFNGMTPSELLQLSADNGMVSFYKKLMWEQV